MADLGSSYPIQLRVEETSAMKLKWIAGEKQQAKSQIMHLKQAIEDLVQGKIPQIERQIMAAQQQLDQLEHQEKLLQSSVEAEQI